MAFEVVGTRDSLKAMNWKERQNRDGGWSYNRGCSWTEPTAFVLLAQIAQDADPASFRAGLEFLKSLQRRDGGWSPQKAVTESTWVTSMAALLPAESLGEARVQRAHEWLIGQTGRESSWQWRLRQRLQGNTDAFPDGWPWFPGAAAWVIPTSFGILAFEKALRRKEDSRLRERVDSGRKYLLTHVCADGGWNHGASRALGRDGDSYPETTGIALLALRGAPASPAIERAKARARKHLAECRTAEGISWLTMGLAAHGEKSGAAFQPVCRTTMDWALMTIAGAEKNPLVS